MTELIKIAFLGIAGVLLALQFKGVKPEYATYIGMAVGRLIFYSCMRQVEFLTTQFSRLREYLNGALFVHFAKGDWNYLYL